MRHVSEPLFPHVTAVITITARYRDRGYFDGRTDEHGTQVRSPLKPTATPQDPRQRQYDF